MLKNLLLYRFGIFNGTMIALLGYLASKGYLRQTLDADSTGIVILIALLFTVLVLSTGHRIWSTSTSLNMVKCGHSPEPQKTRKRVAKIQHIRDGAAWLAYLGLIGTVVGFIVALSGVDLGALSTAQGVQAMIPELMTGMRIALYTTLAGSFFGIWTEMNYRMLHTATVCLVEDEKATWSNE